MSNKIKSLIIEQPLHKENSIVNIAKNFTENTICYVLITCKKPKGAETMQVDLFFEGDKTLAAHLITSAQGVIDN